VENNDCRIAIRAEVDLVFCVHDDTAVRAAQLHPRRQRAPAAHPFVFVIARTQNQGISWPFAASARAREDQSRRKRRSRQSRPQAKEKVTPAQPVLLCKRHLKPPLVFVELTMDILMRNASWFLPQHLRFRNRISSTQRGYEPER